MLPTNVVIHVPVGKGRGEMGKEYTTGTPSSTLWSGCVNIPDLRWLLFPTQLQNVEGSAWNPRSSLAMFVQSPSDLFQTQSFNTDEPQICVFSSVSLQTHIANQTSHLNDRSPHPCPNPLHPISIHDMTTRLVVDQEA